MKVTYNWLKEFVNFDASPEELIDVFINLGMGVEEWKTVGRDFQDSLLTAQVKEIRQHPELKNLKVLTLFTGKEKIGVVSGAPNIKEGSRVLYAPPETQLGSNTVQIRDFRGIKSKGIVLSLEDMGLEEKSEGLFLVDQSLALGENPLPHLGLPDTVYDLEIGPNRPDLLGVIGIARDLCSYFGLNLNLPSVNLKVDLSVPVFPIQVNEKNLCPRYIGRVIQDVYVKSSPPWLAIRLALIGLRQINNIVDITNYVMWETGHPLHAFDLSKLKDRIVVRRAHPEETIITLDNETKTLVPEHLVIADIEKSCAIAGIIGGAETSVTERTKSILLESAYFDPVNIRKTRRNLKIDTESSYRFERKADWNMVNFASQRAAYLFQELSGGKVGAPEDVSTEFHPVEIALRKKRLNKVLGFEIAFDEAKEILTKLGLELVSREKDILYFKIPNFRRDIQVEEDLIEEVARLHGYEHIPSKITRGAGFVGKRNRWVDQVSNALVYQGFMESTTISFVGPDELKNFGIEEEKCIRIRNPLNIRFAYMRPLIIPTLLWAVKKNLNKGKKLVKIFEISKIYQKKNGKHIEKEHLSIILTGTREKKWLRDERPIDYFDIKGVYDALNRKFSLNFEIKETDSSFLQKGLSFVKKNKELGFMGILNKKVREFYDIEQPVYIMELDTSSFHLHKMKYKPLYKFPPLHRDLSFLGDKYVSYERLKKALSDISNNINLIDFDVIDVYEGSPLPSGKRNITVHLSFRDPERTLSERDVDDKVEDLIKYVENKTPFVLRRI